MNPNNGYNGDRMILYRYRSIDSALKEIEFGTFHFATRTELNDPVEGYIEYYGAAEPPVWWWRSHLSGLSEPPRLTTGYLAFPGSNP